MSKLKGDLSVQSYLRIVLGAISLRLDYNEQKFELLRNVTNTAGHFPLSTPINAILCGKCIGISLLNLPPSTGKPRVGMPLCLFQHSTSRNHGTSTLLSPSTRFALAHFGLSECNMSFSRKLFIHFPQHRIFGPFSGTMAPPNLLPTAQPPIMDPLWIQCKSPVLKRPSLCGCPHFCLQWCVHSNWISSKTDYEQRSRIAMKLQALTAKSAKCPLCLSQYSISLRLCVINSDRKKITFFIDFFQIAATLIVVLLTSRIAFWILFADHFRLDDMLWKDSSAPVLADLLRLLSFVRVFIHWLICELIKFFPALHPLPPLSAPSVSGALVCYHFHLPRPKCALQWLLTGDFAR